MPGSQIPRAVSCLVLDNVEGVPHKLSADFTTISRFVSHDGDRETGETEFESPMLAYINGKSAGRVGHCKPWGAHRFVPRDKAWSESSEWRVPLQDACVLHFESCPFVKWVEVHRAQCAVSSALTSASIRTVNTVRTLWRWALVWLSRLVHLEPRRCLIPRSDALVPRGRNSLITPTGRPMRTCGRSRSLSMLTRSHVSAKGGVARWDTPCTASPLHRSLRSAPSRGASCAAAGVEHAQLPSKSLSYVRVPRRVHCGCRSGRRDGCTALGWLVCLCTEC